MCHERVLNGRGHVLFAAQQFYRSVLQAELRSYNLNFTMPVQRSYGMLAVSITMATCLLLLLFFFSHLGGLLNRCRGGYVNFRKPAANTSSDSGLDFDYWPAEISKNLLFAVPTAAIVVRRVQRAYISMCIVCGLAYFDA